jgi:hypothetical protein
MLWSARERASGPVSLLPVALVTDEIVTDAHQRIQARVDTDPVLRESRHVLRDNLHILRKSLQKGGVFGEEPIVVLQPIRMLRQDMLLSRLAGGDLGQHGPDGIQLAMPVTIHALFQCIARRRRLLGSVRRGADCAADSSAIIIPCPNCVRTPSRGGG